MITDTHLLISQILYKYILNKLNFKLNRLAFAYGNIKPDFIDKDIKCPHISCKSLIRVNKYSEELMSRNISIKEFSECLGIICHFVCDYFCLYHQQDYEKKGIIEHLLYEIILHIKLLMLLLRGKLNLEDHEVVESSTETIIMMLQKKYNMQSMCINRDITFALLATTQITKLIVSSSKLYIQQNQLGLVKGGSL